tara:strand:+ start:1111 stop:1410 length:300 start_codon:yes stop_codon:yes gene_type:complete
MKKEYKVLMKQYGGFIPFDEIAKMKRSKMKKRVNTKKRSKLKKRGKKSCGCDNSQVIVEKDTGKKRCSKCTEPGIIIRSEDDSLYILKKIRSIKKWVKI